MARLDKAVVEDLRTALDGLCSGTGGAGGWDALPSLARLAQNDLDLRIDLAATDALGAPVVIALPRAGGEALFDRLTPRQREVARSIVSGATNAQIAQALGITLGTVKDHVHAVLERLGLSRRQQIITLFHGGTLADGAGEANPSEDG